MIQASFIAPFSCLCFMDDESGPFIRSPRDSVIAVINLSFTPRFLSMFFLKFTRLKAVLLLLAAFTLLAVYAVQRVESYSHGIVGQSRSGCANYGCHGGSSSATVVKIWTDASQIVVGQTYTFHLSVANSSEAGAGCDVSIDNSAVLATSDPGLQVYYNEIAQTSPLSFSGDSAVWTFSYTPKKAGTSHIYAAGNAVNMDARADGGGHYNLA